MPCTLTAIPSGGLAEARDREHAVHAVERVEQLVDAQDVPAHQLDARIVHEVLHHLGRAERVVVEQDDLAGIRGEELPRHFGADHAHAAGGEKLVAGNFHDGPPCPLDRVRPPQP
jgi:hypothetical protein